ncbi:hypothetical protein EG68_11597 [Paragonimus skrjabini miyazakii]|uniref:Uncharacterized protein n=1 Tax=Paragonimus skrjabini miyazakii TaxID=59628 RepID=A0A8S9YCZ6_9TREM|nr:hypothetical protein EG68_11597 [Paragonimus skrjabini miyazakii]
MFDRALIMLDLALPLMDSISISASSAGYVEVLTDVLSIRRVTLQLRSWIHYRLGNILEAEADARSCLELLPTDALCSYIHAICMLVSGRFVETLKSAAPVISRAFDIRVNNTPEFVYLNYLKEWVRYTYQHLTLPMSQFHWLSNLPNVFKQSWIKAIQLSSVVGYIEQPGIDYELRGFLLTPQYMHSLLSGNSSAVRLHAPQPFESHDPKRQANLTDSCPTSSRLLQMSPPECLRSQLKELSDALCLLDATFSLILASGSTSNPRSMPLVNRRHRLAFVLGALHGAEFIRHHLIEFNILTVKDQNVVAISNQCLAHLAHHSGRMDENAERFY